MMQVLQSVSATPQFYGPETDYRAEDWEAPGLKRAYHRADLPRWRVPQAPRSPRWRAEHRAVPNPAGEAGSLGDYTMQQPRAKLTMVDCLATLRRLLTPPRNATRSGSGLGGQATHGTVAQRLWRRQRVAVCSCIALYRGPRSPSYSGHSSTACSVFSRLREMPCLL